MELIGIAGIPSHKHRGWQVRFAIAASLMLLSGCGPGLVFNSSNFMSPDEMLARASHVFVGVIQKHEFESWPFFRLRTLGADPFDPKYWRILRREVRVEMVLRGVEPRKVINIYEIAGLVAQLGTGSPRRTENVRCFLSVLRTGGITSSATGGVASSRSPADRIRTCPWTVRIPCGNESPS